MHSLEEKVLDYLKKQWQDRGVSAIDGFQELLGGWSKEVFAFDVHTQQAGQRYTFPMLLRKDLPAVSAILINSRKLEHDLLNRLHEQGAVPVPKSHLVEMDPSVFGEPAMFIERMVGGAQPDSLLEGPEHAVAADSVARDLCEKLAALHRSDVQTLNSDGILNDPKAIGVETATWDRYIDTTLDYLIHGYASEPFDSLPIHYDGALHLRRNKPRPLPLVALHGELNPSNVLFKEGKVLAVVDWENAHLGDPREDLGWFSMADTMLRTKYFQSVNFPGGFLGYYNHLTGFQVTPTELSYFQVFSYLYNMLGPLKSMKRHVLGMHSEVLQMYMFQSVFADTAELTQLLGYPPPSR